MRGIFLLGFLLLLGVCDAAEAAPPLVIELWPEGVPGLRADATDARFENGRLKGVHYPTLTRYAPERAKATGTAVILCPSGGYAHLNVGVDGGPHTRWLNDAGVTVFVLSYRTKEYHYPAQFQDVLRAVRLVRAQASELQIDPARIGVLGLSAGGHLAGCAATMFDAADGLTGAPLDRVSARPDFAILFYPVVTLEEPFAHRASRSALLGASAAPELAEKLSLEKRVRPDTPPIFLVASMQDEVVPVENSLQLHRALHAQGVLVEAHFYATGTHAGGLDPKYALNASWPQRCVEWLRFSGFLTATKP